MNIVSVCWLLCITRAVRAQNPLPSDYGPDRHRLVSAKSWTVSGLPYLERNGYQWLPDGRIFVWIGNDYKWQALLVDTKTGKQEALPLFSKLYVQANPPNMGADYSYVMPDGKSVCSFLNAFSPSSPVTVEFFRTLSFDGYDMHIQRIRHAAISYVPFLAWEWNASYHGWVQCMSFVNQTGRVPGVAHFDLAHPETPRIVEMTPASLPDWGFGRLRGVTAKGEGVLTPDFEGNIKEWTREHKMPVSLVDIEKGTRPPTNYLIPVPREGSLKQYVVSPDTRHIVWLLEFQKPHTVPGQTKLYKTDEIWICDLDGTDMHRLAYQATGSKTVDDAIRDIAWKDNQTVSFFLGGVLSAMPLR
ncbi:MAG: hypothetical protein JWN14_1659 [Chthonomonadales bacterium]|nr:hypothetical protein [Chthonomonadales bacterium]